MIINLKTMRCCQALTTIVIVPMILIFSVSVAADPRSAAENYVIHCQGCHGAEGQGMPPVIPKFTNELKLFLGSSEGRAYLIRVPGASMAPISDADLAEVMNWIVKNFVTGELPSGYAPYAGMWVSQHRKPALQDPAAKRVRFLSSLD